MRRRTFVSALAAAVAGAAFDPERLLWVPGKKTIFDLGANREPSRLVTVLFEDGSRWEFLGAIKPISVPAGESALVAAIERDRLALPLDAVVSFAQPSWGMPDMEAGLTRASEMTLKVDFATGHDQTVLLEVQPHTLVHRYGDEEA